MRVESAVTPVDEVAVARAEHYALLSAPPDAPLLAPAVQMAASYGGAAGETTALTQAWRGWGSCWPTCGRSGPSPDGCGQRG